jgi:regulator of protease activity HflC (stomatin/prohibitin superfamily)
MLMKGDPKSVAKFAVLVALLAAGGVGGCLAFGPIYRVWEQEKAGQAELARAESNRKIAILEASAKQQAAVMLAQAEVERAKGVAQANQIIGEGLKGHEEYLRYLWLMGLEHVASSPNGSTVVYVPTETNLPILEASRKP